MPDYKFYDREYNISDVYMPTGNWTAHLVDEIKIYILFNIKVKEMHFISTYLYW